MKGIIDAIGNTPLVQIETPPACARLFAKFEGANPGGSVKDRIGVGMVEGAESRGKLRPGDTIIEATSGNTGVGLALVAAAKGYRCVIVLPEHTSEGKKKAIRAFGAEIVETPEQERMPGSVRVAREMARENRWFLASQFDNPDNPACHARTAAEALRDLGQAPDALVLGWGTGGTLTGMAVTIKAVNPSLLVFSAEPAESPHGIEGIAPGFVPENLDESLIDERLLVSTDEAWDAAKRLVKKGYPVGPSSGAAWVAATRACEKLGEGKVVLTLFPDRCDRYEL